MLNVKNLNIKVKDRYLVKNLSFNLNKKDKLAVIGEEGNGKSTLLKSLLGICEYSEVTGSINFGSNIVGYVPQMIPSEKLDLDVKKYIFENSDYYEKIKVLYKHLEELNLDEEVLDKKIKVLSGGEKVKISILKVLLEDSDILFLDEPTNDLDLLSLSYLENFIKTNDLPIMYVSHDETLLSKTANMVLHLEQQKNKTDCKTTLMSISYDEYIKARLNLIEKQTREAYNERREYKKKEEKLRQIMQKVEYRQNTISRGDPHGAKLLKKKMHSLKSQEKKLDSVLFTEVPDTEENISFFFNDIVIPTYKKILELNMEELKVGDKVLSKNISLNVTGNTHICIIGNNGVGKTTLIKEIYEQLKDRIDIKVGYMPQNYDEILDNYSNAISFITDSKNKDDITKARTFLGNMKFTKEEMLDSIKELSSGTKSKLFLIKLVLDKCEVLILDEPTRNVSPLSNPIIRKVLSNFKGTIISVSHDRKYINEVIDTLYILDQNGLHITNLEKD